MNSRFKFSLITGFVLIILIGLVTLPIITEKGINTLVEKKTTSLTNAGLTIKEVKVENKNYFNLHKEFLATVTDGRTFLSFIEKNTNILPDAVAKQLIDKINRNKSSINKSLNGTTFTITLDSNVYENKILVHSFLTNLPELTASLQNSEPNKIGEQFNTFLKDRKLGLTFNMNFTGNIKTIKLIDLNETFKNNKKDELSFTFKDVYFFGKNKYGSGFSAANINFGISSQKVKINFTGKDLVSGADFNDKFNNSIITSMKMLSIDFKEPTREYTQHYSIANMKSINKIKGSDTISTNYDLSIDKINANLNRHSKEIFKLDVQKLNFNLAAGDILTSYIEKILTIVNKEKISHKQGQDIEKNLNALLQHGLTLDLKLSANSVDTNLLKIANFSFDSANKLNKNNATLKTIPNKAIKLIETNTKLTINENDRETLLKLNPFVGIAFKGAKKENGNIIINFQAKDGKFILNGKPFK